MICHEDSHPSLCRSRSFPETCSGSAARFSGQFNSTYYLVLQACFYLRVPSHDLLLSHNRAFVSEESAGNFSSKNQKERKIKRGNSKLISTNFSLNALLGPFLFYVLMLHFSLITFCLDVLYLPVSLPMSLTCKFSFKPHTKI